MTLLAATLLPFAPKAQTAPPGEWRLHNAYHGVGKNFGFDRKIIDTKDKVYFLTLGVGYWSWSAGFGTQSPFLFVYDKKEDVMESYNAKNYLHGSIVKNMWYNAAKKYFLIVYDDFNIDILYTDDRCYNVPGLASAIVPGTKDINSVTFDPENNRAYVATKFGYLVVDDSKNVITESHLYGISINSVVRVGDYLFAGCDDGLYKSELKRNDKHNSWSSYAKVDGAPSAITNLLTLTGNDFMYIDGANHLYKGSVGADGNVVFDGKDLANTNITGFNEIKDGYFMSTGWDGILVDRTGAVQKIPGSNGFRNELYGASSLHEIWRTAAPKGISNYKYDGSSWVLVPSPSHGESIDPQCPHVLDAANIEYSPKYGVITSNTGFGHSRNATNVGYFTLLSKYSNGIWESTNLYTDVPTNYMKNSHGSKLDSENEDLVWFSTYDGGIMRYNMADKTARQFLPGGGRPNCMVPKFDADGTLWTFRQSPSAFYYWKKEDRAKEDASKLKALKTIANYNPSAFPIFLPCASDGNRNLLILSRGNYNSGLLVYDHKGTLDDSADDNYVSFESLRDQDGQAINVAYVYCMMEDPATGRVWVGGEGGLYWFNPKEAFNSDFHVNRVKVARNDGTGLADYLLEGASIFSMGVDGAGHKWFGTLGNGVVETSSTGSEIIRQLTRENSYLPGNDVIAIGFEPDSNCVWLGTKNGIAQYFSETAPGAEKLDDVLAYPNPVRPDYYGHVTIKGLMDGSLVKILEASGGLVRELGRSEGGMMLWDLTNTGGRRVPTGVYYVATSTSGDSSEANVAKILVMN